MASWRLGVFVFQEIAIAMLLLVLALSDAARGDDAPAAATESASPIVRAPGITFDPRARRIELDGAFCITTQTFLEYAVVTDYGKRHESLFTISCKPEDLQLALLTLLEPVPEVQYQGEARELHGPRLAITAEWRSEDGVTHTARAEDLLYDRIMGRPMERVGFAFTGSRMVSRASAGRRQTDKGRDVFAASGGGSIVAVYHDPDAILDNPLYEGGDVPVMVPTFGMLEVVSWVKGDERIEPAPDLQARRGTPVRLIIEPIAPAPASPTAAPVAPAHPAKDEGARK